MTFAQYETSEFSGTPERLFRFAMSSQTWTYTNLKDQTVYAGTTYFPEVIAMENIVQNLGEGPPTVDIHMASSIDVAQQFVPYQPIFPLTVTVYRRHRDDPDGEYVVEMMGEVAATAFDEEEGFVTFQVRMVSSNFDRKVPWMIYQKPCNYALYGAGCLIDRELFSLVASVVTITEGGTKLSSAAFATKPDHWFRAGFIRRNSTGEVRFVIAHVGADLTLHSPFVDLDPDDSITVYAGCDRSFSTCKSKFNNGNRFFGFQWVPSKNPFTDNVYGTGSPSGTAPAPGGTPGTYSIKNR